MNTLIEVQNGLELLYHHAKFVGTVAVSLDKERFVDVLPHSNLVCNSWP